MNYLLLIIWLYILLFTPLSHGLECSGFSGYTQGAIQRYQAEHRIHPVPESVKALAVEFMPRLWVHPQSFYPIDFDQYLAQAQLIGPIIDKNTEPPSVPFSLKNLNRLNFVEACNSYLKATEVPGKTTAPAYIQVYRDQAVDNRETQWWYFKYTFVFDWSGLAADLNWLARLGATLVADDLTQWHRLDVHTSVIVAVDDQGTLKLVASAQHNHLQTYVAGLDFDQNIKRVPIAAAKFSNELYLDQGQDTPQSYRVIPYFGDIEYLLDETRKPLLAANDIVHGRNSGAIEITLKPVFIQPGSVLAEFPGLLAPAKPLLGRFYIGQDGPPGFDYYAPPAITALVNYVSVGYWRSGDTELLTELRPYLTPESFSWSSIVALMRERLSQALSEVNAQ